ncbi:MAG: MarR family transcriptional regulator, partial [Anaerolineaceae bacterium]|nr:MarR family transcriptional regulator [Anaerolineaceae bacterium]
KEVTNNDLSRRLGVSMPAASQLVDRLVEMGLVEREDNPADRRSKYLTLTAQGRQTLDDMDKATHSWIPTLVSMLSEEEIKIIKPSLRLIVSKINQL